MIENSTHLFDGDAWKAFDKLSDFHPVFKVLEERGDGNARATKHPGPADPLRVPLDGGT